MSPPAPMPTSPTAPSPAASSASASTRAARRRSATAASRSPPTTAGDWSPKGPVRRSPPRTSRCPARVSGTMAWPRWTMARSRSPAARCSASTAPLRTAGDGKITASDLILRVTGTDAIGVLADSGEVDLTDVTLLASPGPSNHGVLVSGGGQAAILRTSVDASGDGLRPGDARATFRDPVRSPASATACGLPSAKRRRDQGLQRGRPRARGVRAVRHGRPVEHPRDERECPDHRRPAPHGLVAQGWTRR